MPTLSRTINNQHSTVNKSFLKIVVSCRRRRQGFTQHRIGNGFTLIELLVVLGILAITVGSSVVFLSSILKGTNQANVTAEVRQNGQLVLDALERQIRNATDVECFEGANKVTCNPANPYQHIKLLRKSALPLHFKCFTGTALIPNGWIGTVESTVDDPSSSSYATLTNQDPIAGVDVSSCQLVVNPASAGTGSPAVVKIKFTVNQGIEAPSRQDFLANAQFETTVSLRNY